MICHNIKVNANSVHMAPITQQQTSPDRTEAMANHITEADTYDDGGHGDGECDLDEKNSIVNGRKTGGPIDGGYGWLIILGSALAQLITGGLKRSRGILFLEMQARFHSSAQSTAWVLSIASTIRLCGAPIASQLVEHFTCRWVVFVSGFITSLGFILCCFAGSLEYMFFSFSILSGIGRMCMYAPSIVIVGLYFDKKRSLAAGLSSAGVGLGTFILPPAIQAAFDSYGWFGAFIIMAGISLHACICGALFRPLQQHWKILERKRMRNVWPQQNAHLNICEDTYTNTKQRDISTCDLNQKHVNHQLLLTNTMATSKKEDSIRVQICNRLKFGKSHKNSNKKKFFNFQLLKDPFFLTYCISLFLFTCAFQTGVIFIPVFAKEQGNSSTQVALLLSIMGITDTIGRVIVGFTFDLPMIKPRRLYLYNVVWFCLAVVCAMIPYARTFAEFSVVVSIFGLFTAGIVGQKSVVIVDILGAEALVHSFGWILLFQGVANLIAPPIAGLLRDVYGTYTNALYGSGALIAFAGSILLCGNICASYRKRKNAEGQNDVILRN